MTVPTPCCERHVDGLEPGNCYSASFHGSNWCCLQCPAWFPPCFSCHRYHHEDGYIRCFECQHVFATKRALRRAFRWRGYWPRVLRLERPWFKSNGFNTSLVWDLWHMWTLRAAKISCCPKCTHDF